MDTFDSLIKRASVREYKSEPVPQDVLEKLVDAGRRAPTARAVEPWEFVVVTDKKMLQALGKMTAPNGEFLSKAASCIGVLCRDTKYYLEDGSAATENILVAAAAVGLGACWVAGDKKPYARQVASLLEAPPELKLVSLISLGWPAREAQQKKIRSLKEVIHWEKFRDR